MPEDILNTKEKVEKKISDAEADLRELRDAALALGRDLREFSKARLHDMGDDLDETSAEMVRQAHKMLNDVERRIGKLEKNVERSVRQNPVPWVAGLLGVIGFGLVLGSILRDKD